MGKLIPDNSVVTFYRRSLTPADALVSAAGENSDPALDNKKIDLEEGEWVTLDATGKAIRQVAAPGEAGLLAFPVWVGNRHDSGAALGITVIAGPHIAKTSLYDTAAAPYAAGDPLTAKLVAGKSVLTKAVLGDPVLARAEGPESADGYLKYNTFNAGYLKA